MSGSFARQAGDALIWKTIQLASTKGLFFVRTLILARLLAPADFGLFAIALSAVGFFLTITELGMVPRSYNGVRRRKPTMTAHGVSACCGRLVFRPCWSPPHR